MPVHLNADASRCTVLLTGDITIADFREGLRLQLDANTWSLPTLIDMSGVTSIDIRFTEMDDHSRFVQTAVHGRGSRGRVAILAPDDAVFGTARMYAAAIESAVPMSLLVARTRLEAEAWLRGGPVS